MTTTETLNEITRTWPVSRNDATEYALDLARELEARGLTLAPRDAATKLADIQAELHELTTNTQAELGRAKTMISMGRGDAPEHLFRAALLSERLNVLDDVRRIVGF